MTQPRSRRWVTNFGAINDITGQHVVELVTGPLTVQRIWCQPNGAEVGQINPRWPRWLWGLYTGAAAGDVRDPMADEAGWMVHRQVYIWNDMQHPRATQSPDQLVDTEGQRVLALGESLWLILAPIDSTQTTDFIWHTRVLVLDPAGV